MSLISVFSRFFNVGNAVTPTNRAAEIAATLAADPSNLVVDDEGYVSAKKYFETQGERYEAATEAFVEILNYISTEGIITGDTADALRAFASYASELKGKIGETMSNAASECTGFVSDIDAADQYLY